MNLRPTLTLFLLATTFLFNACKKDVIHVLNNGKDCEAFYQHEKKINLIIAASTSGITKTFQFSYSHNVISEINVTRNTEPAGHFMMYYASGICLPSGYNYMLSTEGAQYDLNGAFTIENTRVIKRIITPDYSDIFTRDSSTSDAWGYDASNRINYDLPDYQDAVLYDAVINISYTSSGNVQSYTKSGGEFEAINTYEMDTYKNPFKQQDHLLYLMKFSPYVTFPNKVEDVYHYFTLNKNNPLRVRYGRYDGLQYEYTFDYTYSADGYPTNITVYRAEFSMSPTIPDPRYMVEELTITYL